LHLHANHRRRKNFIAHLQVDGVLISDQEDKDKAKAVDAFYELLLGSCPKLGFCLDFDFLEMWTHDLSELEVPFTEEEVCVWGGPLPGARQGPWA
jgi:hypothetical protein